MNEVIDEFSTSMGAEEQMPPEAETVCSDDGPPTNCQSERLLESDTLAVAAPQEMDFGQDATSESLDANKDAIDMGSDSAASADGHNVSFRGSMHHFYCPVCGHTWYAPGWPTYCEKSGCLGHPKEL